MIAKRRAYIVEDSGAGTAPEGPVARFKLVAEREGASIIQHLGSHPTTSVESFREISLAPYSGVMPIGVYIILEGGDRVRNGERVDVVGGKFAMGTLATHAEVCARWAGIARSPEFVARLPLEDPALPTVVHLE